MSRRKKKAKPDNRCCENCVNCLPVGDGDHICNMDPSKVVWEERMPVMRRKFRSWRTT